MGAALSIFVLLSLSVFVTRVAAVALRLTGLDETTARFQALSAFTGTGFTTREAETIVNYPVRRRVVSLLMIVGNLGLVTVVATLVASLVHTDGDVDAVMAQLGWLLVGLALLWFLMLNGFANRIMCTVIGRVLVATTSLGKRRFHRLLQVGEGYSVCEHSAVQTILNPNGGLDDSALAASGLLVLALHSTDGMVSHDDLSAATVRDGDTLILFGRDEAHESLGSA
ncbi:MAG: potassium transporter TrkA [Gammaproteobacteria bacterium]